MMCKLALLPLLLGCSEVTLEVLEGPAAPSTGDWLASGRYDGDGRSPRAIAGLPFRPHFLVLKPANGTAFIRVEGMPDGASKTLTERIGYQESFLLRFRPDGFEVGFRLNTTDVPYHWVAGRRVDGAVDAGTYRGTGVAHAVPLGFDPSALLIGGSNANRAGLITSQSGGVFQTLSDDENGAVDCVALEAAGFALGTDLRCNEKGYDYAYVAWKQVPGKVAVGSYNGDGQDNVDKHLTGFLPEWVTLKAADRGSMRRNAHYRLPTTLDPMDLVFSGPSTDNGIESRLADGFRIGSHPDVNAAGETYHWIALGR